MHIAPDNLTHPKVIALLQEHLSGMHASSPPGCVQALDLSGLKSPSVTFWAAWDGEELLGCGALNELNPKHGEIKSMRTSKVHLRKGVARKILSVILQEAERRGYEKISLETGSSEEFLAAQALYESFGFALCGPFANYKPNSFSVFMSKEIYQHAKA
jgi:putative acetyltransferase